MSAENWKDASKATRGNPFTISPSLNTEIELNKSAIIIKSLNRTFLGRLWILISNPFLYLFKGKIRY